MKILQFKDLPALSQAIAKQFVAVAQQSVANRGRFLTALSGGGTPQIMYELLDKSPLSEQMPWAQTHLFWGDERCILPTAEGSNYKQVMDTFGARVPAEKIHRIKGELPAESAAIDYACQLREFAGNNQLFPRFDLALMGMGSDGHTASLFPEHISDSDLTQPTKTSTVSYGNRPANRVTLTPMIFNSAYNVWFLIAGVNKAKVLAEVVQGEWDIARLPAQRIQPIDGELIFWVDEDAGKLLLPVSMAG